MVDPDNPERISPVSVQPLSGKELAWDMLRRQGPLAIGLAVALYFIWTTWMSDRAAFEARQASRDTVHAESVKAVAVAHAEAVKTLATQQTEQLKDQATVFQTEQQRTERILGAKVASNAQALKEVASKVEKLSEPQN